MHSALKFHSVTSRQDFAMALSLFWINLYGLLKIKKSQTKIYTVNGTGHKTLVFEGPESNGVTQLRETCPCCSAKDPEQFGA